MNLPSATHPQRKSAWYNHYRFPLIPVITNRPGNDHNAPQYGFTWLGIKLWSLDHVAFEFAFVFGSHWGVGFIGLVPYLRWAVTIPIPEYWGIWLSEKTGRKSLAQRMPKSFRGRYYSG